MGTRPRTEKLTQPLPTVPMAHGVVQLILGQVAVRGACGLAGTAGAGAGRLGPLRPPCAAGGRLLKSKGQIQILA